MMIRPFLVLVGLGGWASGLMMTMKQLYGPAPLSSVGQRGFVVVTGPAERKIRKKQRRSRSPVLYPAVDAAGAQCWLRLGPSDVDLGKQGATVAVVVTEKDEDMIVVPRRHLSRTAPEKVLPSKAKLLHDLRVGDGVQAKIVRSLGPDLALVHVNGVYRKGAHDIFHKQRGILRLNDKYNNESTIVDCYVQNPEPQSGRLTLSLKPVHKGDSKRAKAISRLRKQIKRGTLRVGATRAATVAKILDDLVLVDAGGLKAFLPLAHHDNAALLVGDIIHIKVLALPTATDPARITRFFPSSTSHDSSSSSSSSEAASDEDLSSLLPPPTSSSSSECSSDDDTSSSTSSLDEVSVEDLLLPPELDEDAITL